MSRIESVGLTRSGPPNDGAIAGLDTAASAFVSLNEARRNLTEQPEAAFHNIGEGGGGLELRVVQEASRQAKTGRLFVIENLPINAATNSQLSDIRDAIDNGTLRPPFDNTFILMTIGGHPDIYLLGASDSDSAIDFACFISVRLKNGDIGWSAVVGGRRTPGEQTVITYNKALGWNPSGPSWGETIGTIISVILSLIADARAPVTRVEADAKLNKARVKRGKPPIPAYWRIEPPKPTVLTPDAVGREAQPTTATRPVGTHASPRPHDRRGHPRHLSGERTIWVRSTRVNALIPHLTRDRSHYEIKLSKAAPPPATP